MRSLHFLSHWVERHFNYRSLGLVLAGGLLLGVPAVAQTTVQLRLPNLSAPGNRESGSTRSTTCIDPAEQLVALMPTSNYGLTQSGYPSFFFYVPPTEAKQVKFVVYNETTNELFYQGQFTLKEEAGIIGIPIPDNGFQQPLTLNESYVWYMAVMCDVNDPSADVVVEGTVKRVDSIQGTSNNVPLPSLPAIYAGEGLWHDALTAAAMLKLQRDDSSAWNDLLTAVDLSNLTTATLLVEGVTATEQTTSSRHQ
jgi:hypothetical protein